MATSSSKSGTAAKSATTATDTGNASRPVDIWEGLRRNPSHKPHHPRWCRESECIGVGGEFWRHAEPALRTPGENGLADGAELVLRLIADENNGERPRRKIELFISIDSSEPQHTSDLVELSAEDAKAWGRTLLAFAERAWTC